MRRDGRPPAVRPPANAAHPTGVIHTTSAVFGNAEGILRAGLPRSGRSGQHVAFKHDVPGDAARDLDVARRPNPDLQTSSRWLEAHGSAIPRH